MKRNILSYTTVYEYMSLYSASSGIQLTLYLTHTLKNDISDAVMQLKMLPCANYIFLTN